MDCKCIGVFHVNTIVDMVEHTHTHTHTTEKLAVYFDRKVGVASLPCHVLVWKHATTHSLGVQNQINFDFTLLSFDPYLLFTEIKFHTT